MKIEFKNGSSIQSIDVKMSGQRSKRANLMYYNFNVPVYWYEKLWNKIYCAWDDLLMKLGVRRW